MATAWLEGLPEAVLAEVAQSNRELLLAEARGDLPAATFVGHSLAALLEEHGADEDVLRALYTTRGRIAASGGRFQDAVKALGTALRYTRAKYGRQHRETANTQVYLGRVHLQLGETAQAKKHYEEALATIELTDPTDYEGHARIHTGLGEMYLTALDRKRASSSFASAMAAHRAANAANTAAYGIACTGLGLALSGTKHKQSIEKFETAVQVLTEATSPVDPLVVRARLGLCRAQLYAGSAAAAKVQLAALLSRLRSLSGSRDRDIVDVTRYLAEALVELGDDEKARQKLVAAAPSAEKLHSADESRVTFHILLADLKRLGRDFDGGYTLYAEAAQLRSTAHR